MKVKTVPSNPRLETLDCLDARLVELDLLEQALNEKRDLTKFKLQRLADLQARRKTILGAKTDRHGKEICDGDIISGVGHGVVEFTPSSKWAINRSRCKGYEAFSTIPLKAVQDVEIIGNTRANPELLS